MADTILKEPRNVSIRLNGQVGRYVKIELYFSNVWLSISEVHFTSSPARGRYEAEKPPPANQNTAPAAATEIVNKETESITEEATKTQGK